MNKIILAAVTAATLIGSAGIANATDYNRGWGWGWGSSTSANAAKPARNRLSNRAAAMAR